MPKIVLIATAWGPAFGGVNAFNQDLAMGLAKLLAAGEVYCLLPGATAEEEASARNVGVRLVTIPGCARGDRMHHDLVDRTPGDLVALTGEDVVWVGHDMITGPLALACSRRHGGRVVLIHHMHYADYSVLHYKDDEADRKAREQKAMFAGAREAILFGVGPLLAERCREMARREVHELLPGFLAGHEEGSAGRSAEAPIRALTFGRMDAAEDRLKNGRLAVAAFGSAIAEATADEIRRDTRLLEGSRFTLVGVSPEQDTAELKEVATRHADRFINVLALAYDEDRDVLRDRLSTANLSFMLSWHEGFGLVGWEAIAFGVPLVLSRQSGLFRLLETRLGGAGPALVVAIDVHNPRDATEEFHLKDLKAATLAVRRVSSDLPRYLRDAARLRQMLIDELGCTWTGTARTLLAGLGHPFAETPAADPLPPMPVADRSDALDLLRRTVLAVYDGSHLLRGYRFAPDWSQLVASLPDDILDRLRPLVKERREFDDILAVIEKNSLSGTILESWLRHLRAEWPRLHPAVRLRLKRIAPDVPEIAGLPELSDDERRFAATPWRKADRVYARHLDSWHARLRDVGVDLERREVDWERLGSDPNASRKAFVEGVTVRIQIDVALAESWFEADPERLASAITYRATDAADSVLAVLREALTDEAPPDPRRKLYLMLHGAAEGLAAKPFALPPGAPWDELEARR